MDVVEHCRLLAGYNLRMNRQVYQASAKLDAEALDADRGAYFRSISGTLNHLLVTDLIWLARFATHSERYESLRALAELPRPDRLDQIIYPQFAALACARTLVDDAIVRWSSDELNADDLSLPLAYHNTKGEGATRNFGELVMHLFNHQTHHRGQAGCLLSQQGIDVGVTDFLIDIPRLDG